MEGTQNGRVLNAQLYSIERVTFLCEYVKWLSFITEVLMKLIKFPLAGFVLAFCASVLCAASFDSGYALFSTNRPAEAIPYFTAALAEPDVPPSVYMYLGIAFYQTGRYAESLETFEKGLAASGTDKRILAFNAGNTAFALKDYARADELYSLACAADPSYAAPVLNRANTRISLNKLEDALSDYRTYLALDPSSAQREPVERMIAAIEGELALKAQEAERLAQEAERLKAEEARLAKEAERIAAEKAEAQRLEAERAAAEKAAREAQLAAEQAAEAERRRKLLEEVAASLQDTETTNMNAGTEGVIDYEYESELD